MPDYHGEGGATVQTERYAALVAQRDRQREADRFYILTLPQPADVQAPGSTSTETPAPRERRQPRRPNDNPTRPRKRDKAGASRLRRELHGALLYNFSAERAMVRDSKRKTNRDTYHANLDALLGSRPRRKR